MTPGVKAATAEVLGEIAAVRVIPVVVLDDAADAAPLADALAGAGLRCVEVTLRTIAGEEAIAVMARRGDLLVGAGTVLDVSQVERVARAGARFVVSPGFDDEVVAACRDSGVLALPGAVTPTEIQRARRAGLDTVKFFPAEALGGIEVIDALSAPFPGMRFVPTGGITPANIEPYLAHRAVLAVGGSWMVQRRLLAGGQWQQVARLAGEAAQLAAEAGPPDVPPATPRQRGTR
jgi:2-dehydro-3-deoxyphosphogluconate aldolase/(4S)-4-hydroxy-2-oxoglutarate aldolase